MESESLRQGLRYLLPILLFLVTFFTTTIAGVFWLNKDGYDLANFTLGLPYSLSILFILASHEFGHYFAARYHKVQTTLPYFIPAPPIFLPFGTMGAVIRTRTPIPTRNAMFDIGVAGPIAGFIASLVILIVGLRNLPPPEYLYSIHPEYLLGMKPEASVDLTFGNTLLYSLLSTTIADGFVPPMNEIYHYPFLCVGWFGLFVTAMNLLPVGQLDGGHIAYAMFGAKHRVIARVTFAFLILLGLAGAVPHQLGTSFGWVGWLLWAAILFFVLKLDHPPIADPEPLTPNRMLVGWLAFVIFVLSFSPTPINLPL